MTGSLCVHHADYAVGKPPGEELGGGGRGLVGEAEGDQGAAALSEGRFGDELAGGLGAPP